MPFAVVGSDKEYQVNGKRVLGRKTAWGVVEGEWAEVFAVSFPIFYADFWSKKWYSICFTVPVVIKIFMFF